MTIIGDAGMSRVERKGEGYLVTHGDRKVYTRDVEYALQVCRTFAQKGEKDIVA